jgi:hypothetical protein
MAQCAVSSSIVVVIPVTMVISIGISIVAMRITMMIAIPTNPDAT